MVEKRTSGLSNRIMFLQSMAVERGEKFTMRKSEVVIGSVSKRHWGGGGQLIAREQGLLWKWG